MPKLPRASSRPPVPHGVRRAPTVLVSNVYFQLGGADRMRAALERSLELLEPLPPGPELVDDIRANGVAQRASAASRRRSGSSGPRRRWRSASSSGSGASWSARTSGAVSCAASSGTSQGSRTSSARSPRQSSCGMPLVIPAYVNLADQVWRQRGPAAALEIQTEAIDVAIEARGQRRPGRRQSRAGCSTTWAGGTSSCESPRMSAASRRCTARHNLERWRRRTRRSCSSMRGALDEGATRRRGRCLRTRGRSRTHRCSGRRSPPRRSSPGPWRHGDGSPSRRGVPPRHASPAVVPSPEPHRRRAGRLRRRRRRPRRKPARQRRHGRRARSALCSHRRGRRSARGQGVLHAEAAAGGRRSAASSSTRSLFAAPGEEDAADAILEELGVPPPPAQTAARTAK